MVSQPLLQVYDFNFVSALLFLKYMYVLVNKLPVRLYVLQKAVRIHSVAYLISHLDVRKLLMKCLLSKPSSALYFFIKNFFLPQACTWGCNQWVWSESMWYKKSFRVSNLILCVVKCGLGVCVPVCRRWVQINILFTFEQHFFLNHDFTHWKPTRQMENHNYYISTAALHKY